MVNQRKLLVSGSALVLVACSGAISDGPQDCVGADCNGGGGNGPGPVAEFKCVDPGKVEAGPTPLRRLSHVEYNNTIAALFGDTSNPAKEYSRDPTLLGFDNNLTQLQVPSTLAEDYFNGADAIATRAANNLARIMPCTTQDQACADQFIEKFGLKVYRQPLVAEEKAPLSKLYGDSRAAGDDHQTAIRLVLTAMLQSPQFLFRAEYGVGAPSGGVVKLSPYEVASRLSYLIYASMPDDVLFAAAAAGELVTLEQVMSQAQRMLADPKARPGIARFTEQWVPASSITADHPNLQKDLGTFRDWTPNTAAMLYGEVSRFLDHVTWTDGGTLEKFLTAPYTFWDRNLNTYYSGGATPAAQSAGLVQVDQDPTRYAGIMTKGGLMALMGRPNATRPVGRGVFIRDHLLCKDVPPPAPDPKIDEAKRELEMPDTSNLTAKERLGKLIDDAGGVCVSCHSMFNSLGLAMENFDGSGRFRATDKGKAIDTSGAFVEVSEAMNGPFANYMEMLTKIAGSVEAKECFVKQVFRFTAGRAENAADACTLAAIDGNGRQTGYDVRQLILGMIASEGFLYRSDG